MGQVLRQDNRHHSPTVIRLTIKLSGKLAPQTSRLFLQDLTVQFLTSRAAINNGNTTVVETGAFQIDVLWQNPCLILCYRFQEMALVQNYTNPVLKSF